MVFHLSCPTCHSALQLRRNGVGAFWTCEGCGGQAVMVPQVREATGRDRFRALWGRASAGDSEGVACPSCGRGMGHTDLTTDGGTVRLDTCRPCQLVWFDAGESDAIEVPPDELPPEGAVPLTEKELEARQTVAREMVRMHAEARKDRMPEGPRSVFAVLGLPVEHKPQFLAVRPIVTWIVVAAIAHAFVFLDSTSAIEQFGFLPAEPGSRFGLTLFSSMFIHAGLLHALASIYFLMVFGDDVEVALGRLKFAAVLAMGTAIGNVSYGLFGSSPAIPCVGSSAAISAVLVFYAMAFPNNRIGLATIYLATYSHVSARGALLFWLGMQVVVALLQKPGLTSVSAAAHCGGAAVGLVTWWDPGARGRRRTKSSRPPPRNGD